MRDSAIKNINGINNDKFPPYRNNSFILFKIIESLGLAMYVNQIAIITAPPLFGLIQDFTDTYLLTLS